MFLRLRYNLKLCFLFLCLIIVVNVFLLFAIYSQENVLVRDAQETEKSKYSGKKDLTASDLTALKIREESETISGFYKIPFLSSFMEKHLNTLLSDLKISANTSEHLLAQSVSWVTWQELLPREGAPLLGSVLNALRTLPITFIDNALKGTQLKLMVSFSSNYKAIFKPKWYPTDIIIEGPVYAGKDRHFGEIAAFHLSILLGLPLAPLTVGRSLNVQSEILPVASPHLSRTFSVNKANETCMYGVCYYCHPTDPVCAENGILDGTLIFWLPEYMEIKKYKHPWRRTYRKGLSARWETDVNFCAKVAASQFYKDHPSVLLDLIDTAIFDFLIDNGDRHHFEMFARTVSPVLLIDNGKSFGNPHVDHIDILAPLYQCCRIRYAMYERLLTLKGGTLTKYLSEMLKASHNSIVLVDSHLNALERRLLMIMNDRIVILIESMIECALFMGGIILIETLPSLRKFSDSSGVIGEFPQRWEGFYQNDTIHKITRTRSLTRKELR